MGATTVSTDPQSLPGATIITSAPDCGTQIDDRATPESGDFVIDRVFEHKESQAAFVFRIWSNGYSEEDATLEPPENIPRSAVLRYCHHHAV